MERFYSSLIVYGWVLLILAAATAGGDIRCGRSVDYHLPDTSHHCLSHNSTTSAAATAVLHHSGGKVSGVLQLLPGQPVGLTAQPEGSVVRLSSHLTVCYVLSERMCGQALRGPERTDRDVHQTTASLEDQRHSNSHLQLLGCSVVALLVLLPLATASFLCCTAGEKSSQSMRNRRLSRKDRKSIAASTDISINITDSDHPLGSNSFTTFHKTEESKSSEKVSSPAVASRASSPHSDPSLLQDPTTHSAQNLLESSLDVGTRGGVKHGTSLSSMISLGPRVPPEGSSLDNLSTIDKPVPSSPPKQSSNMHPSSHLRQHSTPVSLPPPLSPLQKPRPLTVVGQPTEQHSLRFSRPLLPPKPSPHSSSPPLSPVSLSESEALAPVRSGRVWPYRVVHQPSPSLSSLPHLPHTSDGTHCTQCGARLAAGQEPLHLVESAPTVAGGEEASSAAVELCMQCQANDPHYHELDGSDEDSLSSPPPVPHRGGSPEPDPLYERIGSIRRQHMISTMSDYSKSKKPPPPVPSPVPSPNPETSSRVTCSLPPAETNYFPKCSLPSEGAPLPSRPPTLGLVMEEDHNYESLPSTFGVDSPEDILYAHISTPEAEEAETPPYIPENSQRAHMLKIDSQGYAEVVHKEGEEEEPNTPDKGYSPILPLSPASQAIASDYEVPVRIAALPPSPSLLHPSPTHTHPSPIPVPSPMPPFSNLDKVPSSLPLPSERQASLPCTTAGPPLKRQAAIAENPLPLPARSFHVFPQQDRDSLDTRRDSSGSTASYHLSYRLSTASSGLGESMTESLRAIAEESGGEEEFSKPSKTDPAVMKQKIYEVENRSRTKSYPDPEVRATAARDMASHKLKAQTMQIRISFNQDSQTV